MVAVNCQIKNVNYQKEERVKNYCLQNAFLPSLQTFEKFEGLILETEFHVLLSKFFAIPSFLELSFNSQIIFPQLGLLDFIHFPFSFLLAIVLLATFQLHFKDFLSMNQTYFAWNNLKKFGIMSQIFSEKSYCSPHTTHNLHPFCFRNYRTQQS